MTKYRFRKKDVSDGALLDIPYDALGVRVYADISKPVEFTVLWLEEVPQEIEL